MLNALQPVEDDADNDKEEEGFALACCCLAIMSLLVGIDCGTYAASGTSVVADAHCGSCSQLAEPRGSPPAVSASSCNICFGQLAVVAPDDVRSMMDRRSALRCVPTMHWRSTWPTRLAFPSSRGLEYK